MATFLVVLKSNSELLLVKRREMVPAARKGPSVDFFRDYKIALDIMSRYMLNPAT